jgi:glutathione S-transferase
MGQCLAPTSTNNPVAESSATTPAAEVTASATPAVETDNSTPVAPALVEAPAAPGVEADNKDAPVSRTETENTPVVAETAAPVADSAEEVPSTETPAASPAVNKVAKLYYTPTSCGAASFIAAFTAGVNLEVEEVDLATHKTASGADYYAINGKGNVPALVLEDGTVLNEGTSVLQWIADQAPGKVAPVYGTTERYLVQNALNYIASEVHPGIGHLFYPNSDEVKEYIKSKGASKLDYLEKTFIADKEFVVGDSFTIADSYLYICLSWTKWVGIELDPYPKVKAYFERIGNLENVKNAHATMEKKPASVLA